MRKSLLWSACMIVGAVLVWAAAGPLGAAGLLDREALEAIGVSDRSLKPKHRMVGKLICEEPVSTFLSVMSLHGTRPNMVRMTLTDVDGLQTHRVNNVPPHRPLRVSCEDVPPEFSHAAPVVVHLDSRYPTSGVSMHVLRGSPILSVEADALVSLPIVAL